ncbi:MAG: hypothetical protein ACE14P_06050 [Methanotrichaceae archaeon]
MMLAFPGLQLGLGEELVPALYLDGRSWNEMMNYHGRLIAREAFNIHQIGGIRRDIN